MEDMIKIGLAVINSLWFIILMFIGYNWKKQDDKILNVETKTNLIEKNYLHRFEEVNHNLTATELKIITAIKDLEIKMMDRIKK